MSKFHEKAEAQTKQLIGQMLGDELLVQEGKKQQREATEPGSSDGGHDQGIVRDERGQEQPADKERAQRVSRVDRGGATRRAKSLSSRPARANVGCLHCAGAGIRRYTLER
jgi:hypothetical protein